MNHLVVEMLEDDERLANLPKKSGYGTMPEVIGKFDIEFPEFMFYLYLPVKLPNSNWSYRDLPENLKFLKPLLEEIDVEYDDYVYITAKNMWYEQGGTYNREGWHSDGFMSDDTNYIWSDREGTEFTGGQYTLTQDHEVCLHELSMLGEGSGYNCINDKRLVKLDQYVIHRPPLISESGMRGFVKISVSKNKYNLAGNSHNHLLDYDWDLCDRKLTRNDPTCETLKEK